MLISNPMKTLNRTLLASALLMSGLVCTSTRTFGAPITFTVDPSQSSLTISSASLTAPIVGAIPLQQQAPGSLVTDFGGTVEADVSPASIQFVGGSSIVASNSGSWMPGVGGAGGSAPANYGGQASISFPVSFSALVAMRGIVVDATSGPLAISGGTFPAETMIFGFSTNANSVLDYSYSGVVAGSGTYTFTGLSTNGLGLMGSLVTVSNELVLTVPVSYTGYGWIINPNDLQYTLEGTLVARAPMAEPPPEILSLKVSPNQLIFTIDTVNGADYTILGGTNLTAVSNAIDTFTATGTNTERTINTPILKQQFFQVRQD